jgi:hypothetical protein
MDLVNAPSGKKTIIRNEPFSDLGKRYIEKSYKDGLLVINMLKVITLDNDPDTVHPVTDARVYASNTRELS